MSSNTYSISHESQSQRSDNSQSRVTSITYIHCTNSTESYGWDIGISYAGDVASTGVDLVEEIGGG